MSVAEELVCCFGVMIQRDT